MEEQASRMYYEVIDEVCNRLVEDGASVEIDRSTVYALQTEWIKNLEKIQRENINEPTVFSDEEDYILDEDSGLDQLEQNIYCYMMCLFVKVA